MCARFVMASTADDLVALFDVDVAGEQLAGPSFNVAPTARVNILVDRIPRDDPDGQPVRRLEAARWGLVPAWADGVSGAPLVNARIETAATTRSFADAVVERRAVVPATGYYEWTADDSGARTPSFVHLPGDEPLLLAAVYAWWRDPAAPAGSSPWLLSTAVLTRAAAGPLAALHERMPVLVPPEFADEWLDPHEPGSPELLEGMASAAADVAERVVFHAVGTAVGDVRNDSPALVEPVGTAA